MLKQSVVLSVIAVPARRYPIVKGRLSAIAEWKDVIYSVALKKNTLIASSFDTQTEKQAGTKKATVEKFLDEVLAIKIHTIKNQDWGVHLSGGTESLDTNLSKNSRERLMHFSSTNRKHPALVRV